MQWQDRGKNMRAVVKADIMRYTGPEWRPATARFWRNFAHQLYRHPGMIAVLVYRFGQWVEFCCRVPIVRPICNLIYYYWYGWVRTRLQIEIQRQCGIDAGFRIDHYGSILINAHFLAGKNLTIGHGVLVGETDTGVPNVGENVSLCAKSSILGGITLGDNVVVGAAAVVTKSFSDNAVVAGNPAKLLRFQSPFEAQNGHGETLPARLLPEATLPEQVA